MLKRLITGIILAVVVSAGVIFLPIPYLKVVLLLVVLVSAYECAHLVMPRGAGLACLPAILLSVGLSAWIQFGPRGFGIAAWVLPACVLLTCGVFLLHDVPLESALPQISGTLFTVLYVGLLLSFLGLIREFPHGWQWLLMALAVTFAADTGAFFAGRFFGQIKLAPLISPGKTVEGVFGGLLLALGVAFFFKAVIFPEMTVVDGLWVGGIAGLVGPVGDLAESLLKRSVGVKDSSNLLPGHGGFLDRVDALLFTAPAVYWYLRFIR
jgi:phosphatidate cytidylyltransferase